MPRKRSATLTDAEARLMRVLWQKERATVGDIVESLRATGVKRRAATEAAPAYNTVFTILRILEKKGYVAHEKEGRAFVFRPLIAERDARRTAVRHLLARLFDGSASQLVLNVLDDADADPEELRRLRLMLEERLKE